MKYILILIFASNFCFGQGDNVTNPIAVPFGQWTEYSNASATNSGYSPSTCGTFYQDMWFSFTMPLSGSVDFMIRSNVIPTGRFAFFEGTYPGPLTQLDCQTFGATMVTRIVSGTAGQNCLIQISKNAATGASGTYSFSINDHISSYCTPNVSITSDQGSQICSGTTVTFTAIPINGGTTPTYQWIKNGINVATSSSYTTNTLAANDQISCLLYSNASCGYPRPVASNTLTMQVFTSTIPTLSLSCEQDLGVPGGNLFALKTEATFGGTSPSYQWFKNSVAIGSNSNLLVSSGLKNNDTIACQLTSNATCVSTTTASSTIIIKEKSIDSLSCWKRISSGGNYNLGIKKDGTLWAWGQNSNSQLGDYTTTDRKVPTQIGMATDWEFIAAGNYSSYAIKKNGTLWSWGYNGDGQLGHGNTTTYTSPTQVGTSSDWVFIVSKASKAFALKSDGTLWAWGKSNSSFGGGLGDGTTTSRNIPTKIGIDNNWAAVSVGNYHSIALKTDGSLFAWGYNYNGQVGDGTSIDRLSPVPVGTHKCVRISAGYEHNLAIKADGTLWTWGRNSFSGGLGNGIGSASVPTMLNSSKDWKMVQTYQYSNSAIKNNGTRWAWGYGDFGLLGHGGTGNLANITQVGTQTDWNSISVGEQHTLAFKTNASIWAWGRNLYGAFGNNSTINQQLNPIQVMAPCQLCPSTFATITHSICQGSSYLFNGINRTTAGIYKDTLVNSAGCDSIITLNLSVTNTVTPGVTISSNVGNSICSGSTVTFTAAIVNGGAAPAYQWKKNGVNVATSPTYIVSSLVNSDIVSCILTSTVACASPSMATSNSISFTVNAPPSITVNSGTICSGDSFSITPTGANTYTITGGSFNVSPTTTSNYSITGTSAQGCVSSNTAISTVSVNALPTIAVNSGSICAGNSFSITPSGATTYTITGGSFNVSPSTTSNYSITGTSAQGCVSSNTAISTVSVNALPTIAVNSGSICSGNSFSITPSGATTYTITGGSFNVSPTTTTNYSITGTSAQGCVSSNTAISTVSVNALPTIAVNSGSICSGNSFSITPSGATTYTVSGGSFNVSPTTTSNYSITGTSAQGCVSSNTVISTVTVNSTISPGISISTTSTSICDNNAVFTSTITNGGSIPTYQWKKNGVNVGSGLATYSPTSLLNGDVISCILTSNASCASPMSITSNSIAMTVNTAPVISVNNGTICAGNSFSITPSGATTYTVSGGSFNVSPTTTSNYSITGTSTQGCVSSNTAISTVSVNALPTIAVNNGSICAGSSFSITPTGATTYTITGGSFNVSPTTTSNYSITGTSAQGCVSSNTAVSTVSVNALPTIAVNSGTICAGNSFSIAPSGATTYTVSGGSFNVSPTTTSNYSITGTSAQGCVSSNTAVSTVSVNALPPVTALSNNGVICSGQTVTLTATGATTYTWNTSSTTSSIAVSPTLTTTYTVTGTDAVGCMNQATITQSVSLCTGIKTTAITEPEMIKIYPNPNSGLFTVELTQASHIIITDALGNIVLNEKMTEGKQQLNLQHEAIGIYFINIVNDDTRKTVKLIFN